MQIPIPQSHLHLVFTINQLSLNSKLAKVSNMNDPALFRFSIQIIAYNILLFYNAGATTNDSTEKQNIRSNRIKQRNLFGL